jgi:hypothetical protein
MQPRDVISATPSRKIVGASAADHAMIGACDINGIERDESAGASAVTSDRVVES